MQTGFPSVDKIIGGIELGQLVAINGIPDSGKTSFLLSIALHVAEKTKFPITIYSQKHSSQQITKRLLSMLSGVPIVNIENAQLNDQQWNALSTASQWLNEKDIHIREIGIMFGDLYRTLESTSIIIVDGLPVDELEPQQMRIFKKLTLDKQCCILFTGFYNDTKPYISGNVDKVLDLEIIGEEDPIGYCTVSWNRTGKTGDCTLWWNEDCLMFLEPESFLGENNNT